MSFKLNIGVICLEEDKPVSTVVLRSEDVATCGDRWLTENVNAEVHENNFLSLHLSFEFLGVSCSLCHEILT